MHITLLGAGHIGLTIARLLADSGDDVTVVDRSPEALARLAGPRAAPPIATRVVDTAQAADLQSALRGQDAVINALPAFPTNALKYNLTWSVDGLISGYCHPCEAIRGGQNIEVLPLEGLEHFSLDGTEYEAFNTSGGLGTLCETLAGRVQTLDYKSVRYPGHRDLMKLLLEELQLNQDTETLKAIVVVLVFVTVSGLRGGSLVQEVFARKIFADRNEAAPLSAIRITTAAGICVAVDLFREGKLPQHGFIRQEQVAPPDFLANRFGRAYQQSRQVESIG
jgi:saccharopine dehydrogenase-like NADP-dependent oxidoreductase